MLSSNSNDEAIEMLKRNPDKIQWKSFAGNANDEAIKYFINEHPELINKYLISNNPAIFKAM